jgi:hypothetical protein
LTAKIFLKELIKLSDENISKDLEVIIYFLL